MTGKPQGALLEFKVSFSFFIIGLQASEEAIIYYAAVYYTYQSTASENARMVWIVAMLVAAGVFLKEVFSANK